MKPRILCAFLACLVCSSLILAGGKFWETKDYTQWSEKDARNLLQKSPWVYEFQYGHTGDIGMNVSKGTDESDVASEREFRVIVRMGLFSSHPVRQAYVTLMAKGDKARLEKYKDFAIREIDDEIIVNWSIDSVPRGVSAMFELEKQIRNFTAGDLQSETFLSTNSGRRVSLKAIIPASQDGTGVKFVFPRLCSDGKPLVAEGDKTLRFQTKPLTVKGASVAIDGTFKLQDCMFNGKVDY